MRTVLILGAGFGGLELAACLSESFVDEVRIVLVDKNDSFTFGFSKLEILFNGQSPDAVRLPYADLARAGVEFRQERVTWIEPRTRRVVTDRLEYEPDFLVVALGADYDPGATPGFVEDGHEYYSSREPAGCATGSMASRRDRAAGDPERPVQVPTRPLRGRHAPARRRWPDAASATAPASM